jgi:hypothetical protein
VVVEDLRSGFTMIIIADGKETWNGIVLPPLLLPPGFEDLFWFRRRLLLQAASSTIISYTYAELDTLTYPLPTGKRAASLMWTITLPQEMIDLGQFYVALQIPTLVSEPEPSKLNVMFWRSQWSQTVLSTQYNGTSSYNQSTQIMSFLEYAALFKNAPGYTVQYAILADTSCGDVIGGSFLSGSCELICYEGWDKLSGVNKCCSDNSYKVITVNDVDCACSAGFRTGRIPGSDCVF